MPTDTSTPSTPGFGCTNARPNAKPKAKRRGPRPCRASLDSLRTPVPCDAVSARREATRSDAKRTCAAAHRLRVETDRVDRQRWTADASKKKEKAQKSEKKKKERKKKKAKEEKNRPFQEATCQEQRPKEQTVSTPQGRTMAVTPSYLLASLQRGLCVCRQWVHWVCRLFPRGYNLTFLSHLRLDFVASFLGTF